MFAATTTYPYQVVRARLQDQHRNYQGVSDVVRQMWRYVRSLLVTNYTQQCNGTWLALCGQLLCHVLDMFTCSSPKVQLSTKTAID